MRKKLAVVLVLGILIGSLLPLPAVLSETVKKKIDVYYTSLKIKFDRVEKKTNNPVFIYEDTTYVPLRFISENMGEEVTYDPENNTIWIGSKPGDLEKYLIQLKEKEATKSIEINKQAKLFDEVEYDDGIIFNEIRDEIRYYLNSEYMYLTARLGPIAGYDNNNKSCLVFYGDGQEIYRSPDFIARFGTILNSPINIKIDVSNITNLKIVLEGGNTKIGLMNAKLVY